MLVETGHQGSMAYGGEPDINSSTEGSVYTGKASGHPVTAVAVSHYDNHSHYKANDFISCDELGYFLMILHSP